MPIKIKSKRLNRKSRKMKGGSSRRRSSGKKSGSTVTPTIDSINEVMLQMIVTNSKLHRQVAKLESKITDIESKSQKAEQILAKETAEPLLRTFRPIKIINDDFTDYNSPTIYYRDIETDGTTNSPEGHQINVYTIQKLSNIVNVLSGNSSMRYLTTIGGDYNGNGTVVNLLDGKVDKQESTKLTSSGHGSYDIKTINSLKITLIGKAEAIFEKGVHNGRWGWKLI
jgi:hypothetical protein